MLNLEVVTVAMLEKWTGPEVGTFVDHFNFVWSNYVHFFIVNVI